jgi:hydrogenase expression/formation protein HypD
MKYVDEYRDPELASSLRRSIERTVTRPWTLMEVCGGQTHTIVKYGIDQMLPPQVELLHGPGCPVCVTPLEIIDRAHVIASRDDVTFCSFGDMLRVPGSQGDLLDVKARGGDIRVVYSPLNAVEIAASHPERRVVFFAIGFETTAPANAMAVWLARKRRLANFSLLVSHVRVPPALRSILRSPENRVQAFLGPGHVCTVMGVTEYESISEEYGVPIVITGFEPVDLLEGVYLALRQLEGGRAFTQNQYSRVVQPQGNPDARKHVEEVFEVCDRSWRGIGTIPESGLRLRPDYANHDAERLFDVEHVHASEPAACISGLVLRGQRKPGDCAAFGTLCTPEAPLGATMVSSEGACAAYYRYGRHS